MKILIVSNFYYMRGGDVRYAFSLRDLLRQRGHEVRFFSTKHPLNEPTPDERYFLDYIDYAEENKKKSLTGVVNVVRRSVYYQEARQKIRKLVNDFQPDIVHLQNIHAYITPSILHELDRLQVPVVWTLHDYKLVCPNSHYLNDRTGQICELCDGKKFYFPLLTRCKKGSLGASAMASVEAFVHQALGMYNTVQRFLTPGEFLRTKLLQNGFAEKKVKHVPLFIPDDLFKASDVTGGYVLFAGRLDLIKGIDVLLKAALLIPTVRFILAGSFSSDAEQLLRNFQGNNVQYVGMKSRAELLELIDNAAVIVVPSIWFENQPFSILEAFARGKPVIASSIGGMKELIGQNERGMLVEPNSPSQLAEAVSALMSDAREAQRLGQQAFEYVSMEHSEDHHYSRLMEEYQSSNR